MNCPCVLHRMYGHPSTLPLWLQPVKCICECDHAPDEERWAA